MNENYNQSILIYTQAVCNNIPWVFVCVSTPLGYGHQVYIKCTWTLVKPIPLLDDRVGLEESGWWWLALRWRY